MPLDIMQSQVKVADGTLQDEVGQGVYQLSQFITQGSCREIEDLT